MSLSDDLGYTMTRDIAVAQFRLKVKHHDLQKITFLSEVARLIGLDPPVGSHYCTYYMRDIRKACGIEMPKQADPDFLQKERENLARLIADAKEDAEKETLKQELEDLEAKADELGYSEVT